MGIIINGLTDTVTAADGSLNIGGDVTIPGELSYDDVTNIDSVGIITARNGLHVTGGSVGIGTDTISDNLEVFAPTNASLQIKGGAAGSDANRSAQLKLLASGSKLYVMEADATDGSFRILDSSTERLRITSDGKVGLGTQTPDKLLTVSGANTVARFKSSTTYVDLIFQNDTKDNGYIQYNNLGNLNFYADSGSTPTLTIKGGAPGNVGINATNPERRLEVVDTAGSLTFPVAVSNHTDASAGVGAGIAFHLTAGGNTRGDFGVVYAGNNNSDGTDFVFRPNDGSTGSVERLRIKGSSGTILANATIDNTGGHGQIVAHAPTTGNTIYKAIEIGNTDAADTPRGAAICGQPRSNSHLPYTLLGSWDHGDNTDCYYGGGWGGAMRPATRHRFYTNSSYPTSGGSGTERMRILNNGHVNIGDGYLTSVSNSGLHVGRGTGGTAAGESVLAATLGNDSTMVSALLTVKNAGNRGAQGASGGSPLAKFEFNNGTAFEVDKHGRRTLPYQPAFNCKLSTATGANFTGFLVFNSVSYNIGNHYNSSNGRFTAPVDGRYLFTWYTNVEKGGSAGVIWGDWYVNGNARGNRFYTRWDGNWELIGGTIILDLDTNDYVQVYAATSGNWDGGSYGSYSGYLLG